MATKRYLRCPACKSLRTPDAFESPNDTPAQAAMRTIGGRGRCSWDFEPMTVEEAIQIRRRLRAALREMDEALEGIPEDAEDAA